MGTMAMPTPFRELAELERKGLSKRWPEGTFLAGLSPRVLQRLSRQARTLDTTKRQGIAMGVLHEPGSVWIVLNHVVKVYRVGRDGYQALTGICGAGDIVNGDEFLSGNGTAHYLQWKGDCTRLAVVTREKFRELVFGDLEVQRALLRALACRVQTLEDRQYNSGRAVEKRLWAFLVDLAVRHAERSSAGYSLQVGLTQADLASAIGASITSVENALKKLRKTGKVSTSYAEVFLHELPVGDEEMDRSFAEIAEST